MDGAGESQQVELLLGKWKRGDHSSLSALIPLVDRELREIASRLMRNERRGHTLQTTALINEAYIRLLGECEIDWQCRAHFVAVAARLMRQVLIDYARRSRRGKRAAGVEALPLDETLVFTPSRSARLLDLNEALERLSNIDARKVQVVELRYFGGLSVEEAATVLDVSPNTVKRDRALAKAWLKREIESTAGDD